MSLHTSLKSGGPRKSKSKFGQTLLILLIILILGAGAFAAIILFETEKPLITLKSDVQYIGPQTSVIFHVADHKQGVKEITVSINQNGKSQELYQKSFNRKTWLYGAGPNETDGSVKLDIKKAKLKDGEAELTISVRDFSLNGMLKGNLTTSSYPVIIDTKVPKIMLEHTQRYILPGGSGIVVYKLSEESALHGAEINGHFFKGYPVLNRDNLFISYIALDWNAEDIENTRVIATDYAGNEGKAIFSMILKKTNYKKDRINIGDGFLNSKIPEFEQYYPEIKGSMLEKYLFANNEIRKRNAETIKKLCSSPEPKQLWLDNFLRMAGAPKAQFADQRTYYYKGKPVDKQVHLGADIASTSAVEIKAANRGKVVFADYLGIYGNTIILDHGQGIFSLYSHLSRFETEANQIVDKGTVIARSGATGMAGGDHLHFSMLVHGNFVTPVEWWDQHWIDVNIKEVLELL